MMMLNVTADINAVADALKQTSKQMPQITNSVMRIIGKGASKEVNRTLKGVIKGRKGKIGRGYDYQVWNSYTYGKPRGGHVAVFPKPMQNSRGLEVAVMQTLNAGATITPRRGHKYLHIKGDGFYALSKSIRIEGKHFVERGENYAEHGDYQIDIDKMIDKELKKFWG